MRLIKKPSKKSKKSRAFRAKRSIIFSQSKEYQNNKMTHFSLQLIDNQSLVNF